MIRKLFRNKKTQLLRKKVQELSNKKQSDIQNQNQIGYYSEEANKLKEKMIRESREMCMYDLLKNNINLSDVVEMEYKTLSKQPHWDITSDKFVHSERDEIVHRQSVNDYNEIIDQFKKDLDVQKQVMEELNNMQRPYLENGQKGNQQNQFDELKDYSQQTPLSDQQKFNNIMGCYANEKFIINNAQFIPKNPIFKYEKELQKMIEERPVNSHFHHDKGSKFDVLVPEEDKYEHVADRLGHPEIFLTPLETLLRSDRIVAHPGFQDQPFVKIPKAEPDESVNFEQGDVIYHNPIAKDWTSLLNVSGFALPATIFVDSLFFLHDMTPDPEFTNYMESTMRSYDVYSFDNFGIQYMAMFGIAGSIIYCVNKLTQIATKPFVHSIQYSKDRDLIFVKSNDIFGRPQETVYEIAHIERTSPFIKTLSHLEDFGQDGFTRMRCLNQDQDIVVSNNDKFWKEGEKEKFLESVSRLLKKEYIRDGIFEVYGDATETQK